MTLATLRGLRWDLDGDGEVSEGIFRRLTPDQAARIFIEQSFRAPRVDRWPEPLRSSVFDMHVNAGLQATRILQKLLINMGLPCAVDGVIGPKTIEAATAAARLAGRHLVDAYGIARRNYYYALADRRPASRKYARRKDGGKGGWITRAEEFISPKFHLTEVQHRERTSEWH